MSATLCWRPIPPAGASLPDALRFTIEKRWNFPYRATCRDVEYLSGLADAGVDGAQALIDLVNEHETIELTLEY